MRKRTWPFAISDVLRRYTYSYSAQTFRLKPHDCQRLLQSVAEYNDGGELQWSQEYQYDQDGGAWCWNGDEKQYLPRMPRAGMENPTEMHAEYDVTQEEYDEYGRVTLREAYSPHDSAMSEYI